MSVYRDILTLLDDDCVSNLAIFDIITLLDDEACNLKNDCLYNWLFEYLKSKDSSLLQKVREVCIARLENSE